MCTPYGLEKADVEETNALDINVADAVSETHDCSKPVERKLVGNIIFFSLEALLWRQQE